MSLAKLKLSIAAKGAERAAAAAISFALNVVETGAPEGTPIGVFTVEGFPTFKVFVADTQGGQVKASSNLMGLDVGAVAPNAAVDPLISPSGVIVFPNGAVRTWALDIVIAGAIDALTVSLQPLAKKFIATGDVLTFLNTIADGNTVTVQHSDGTPIELTYGARYTTGDAVVPAPSASYTGAQDSGYASWTEDGNARTMAPEFSAAQGNGTGALGNETRTTAKPILRLLTPWRQRFTDKIVLRIAAEEHHRELVSKVRVYAEGGVLDLTAKSWHHYTDVNGKQQWFYGYICELDADNYTSVATDKTRLIRIRIRAYPVDGTMQTQLAGVDTEEYLHYVFNPAVAEHGVKIQVTPSGVASQAGTAYPGVDAVFTTLEDAQRYAAGKTIQTFTIAAGKVGDCPLIEVTENCALTPANVAGFGSQSTFLTGAGYCVVKAASGVTSVTIGRAGPWDTTKSAFNIENNRWRVCYGPTEFRGEAIIFDNDYWSGFNYDTNSASQQYVHWWNGTSNRCTWNMLHALDDLRKPRVAGGAGFQTDCVISGVTAISTLIRLNNTCPYGPPGDYYNSALAVYGDLTKDYDISDFRSRYDAFTLVYSGAGVASYVKSQNNGVTSGTLTLRVDGVAIDTAYALNGKSLAEVVTWINTHANWTAVSLATPDDRATDRSAIYLSSPNSLTGVVSISGTYITAHTVTLVTNTPCTVTTFIDLHCDLYQAATSGQNNRYFSNVQVFKGFILQSIFLDDDCTDCYFGDVFIDNAPGNASAQLGSETKRHVIIRNYADSNIGLYSKNSVSTWADAYCEFSGGIFNDQSWHTASSRNAAPIFQDCHFTSPYTDQGLQVSSNVSSGSGTAATNYPGVLDFDNRPAGVLLDADKDCVPRTTFDCAGMVRISPAPKGPKGIGLPSGTYTKAQMLQLAARCATDNTGTGVGEVALSGKAGAGETGDTVSTVISFDVAA